MATHDLGRVTPMWKGAYSATAEYELNDLVSYNDSTYWHMSASKTTGAAPTDASVWGLMTDASVVAAAVTAAEAAQGAAETAEAAAQAAQGVAEAAQTAANNSAKDSEAYGVGKRNGTDVTTGDPAYHNNAKYYSELAGTAKTAAETAQGAAETARTASQTAQTGAETAQGAAEAAQNASETAKVAAEEAAAIAVSRNTIKTYKDVQNVVRTGNASSVFEAGDQLEVYKASSITAAATSGSSITGVSVAFQTFLNKMGTCPTGVYSFIRNNGVWWLNGASADMTEYGITVSGTAADGDGVNVTVTGKKLTFDMGAADGYDHPTDGVHTHALSLVLHDCFDNVTFDASELLFVVEAADYPSGLSAGTYSITLDHGSYGGGTAQDGTYEFTLTQGIPVGGGLRHSTMGAYQSPSYTHAQIIGGTITTYGADGAVIESGIVVTEPSPSTATSIGTATGCNPTYRVTTAMNFTERCAYGSNLYAESALRQWLNSTAASGWWTSKNKWDRPVTSPAAGFLYGLDPDFVAVLGAVKKRTAKSVADGYGYEDTEETVFLLSQYEVFGSANNSVVETGVDGTTPGTTALPLYVGATNADRIKYLNGNARAWWLRSPSYGYASYERSVGTDGSLSNGNACGGYGAVPACCII